MWRRAASDIEGVVSLPLLLPSVKLLLFDLHIRKYLLLFHLDLFSDHPHIKHPYLVILYTWGWIQSSPSILQRWLWGRVSLNEVIEGLELTLLRGGAKDGWTLSTSDFHELTLLGEVWRVQGLSGQLLLLLYWLNVKIRVGDIEIVLLLLNCVEIVIRLLLYGQKCANLVLQSPQAVDQRSNLIFEPLLLRHGHTSRPLSWPTIPITTTTTISDLNECIRYESNSIPELILSQFDAVNLFVYLRCPRL